MRLLSFVVLIILIELSYQQLSSRDHHAQLMSDESSAVNVDRRVQTEVRRRRISEESKEIVTLLETHRQDLFNSISSRRV